MVIKMLTALWNWRGSPQPFSTTAKLDIPCCRQNLNSIPPTKPSILLLLLHPPSLYLNNKNGRRRRGRQRGPSIGIGIGSLKITKTTLKKAASFAMSLRDPLNLLLLHYGGAGGGSGSGGGGLDLSGGGSDGEWFGKRRRGKIKGLVRLLFFSIALASGILGIYNGQRPHWELGIRVLVPAILGFNARVWRHYWIGLTIMILGFGFYALLQRRRESTSRSRSRSRRLWYKWQDSRHLAIFTPLAARCFLEHKQNNSIHSHGLLPYLPTACSTLSNSELENIRVARAEPG